MPQKVLVKGMLKFGRESWWGHTVEHQPEKGVDWLDTVPSEKSGILGRSNDGKRKGDFINGQNRVTRKGIQKRGKGGPKPSGGKKKKKGSPPFAYRGTHMVCRSKGWY